MFDEWPKIDWARLFLSDTPPLEIFVRGSVMYLALFALLRFVTKRQKGGLGISDVLVAVLLAEAAGVGMVGDYTSVSDSIVIVLTLIFWNYALNWLDYHAPGLWRVFRPPALPLVKDGQVLHRNMRREFVTMEELMSQVRLQGISEIARVREAYLEADGRISVIATVCRTEEDADA